MHDLPIHPHVAIIIIIITTTTTTKGTWGKMFPVYTMGAYRARQITALSILYRGARSKNQPWYPLNRRPGGPTTGLGVLKRKISFPYRGPNPRSSNRSLVSILTTLSGLPLYYIIIIRYVCLLSQAFLPGTSLEPAVIPTAQASSFTLQYFPYYV